MAAGDGVAAAAGDFFPAGEVPGFRFGFFRVEEFGVFEVVEGEEDEQMEEEEMFNEPLVVWKWSKYKY